ncbi:uncharacterized protein LOC120681600 isoform X7 [Panicum virgatum]|uniref:uncharacterized protein LOC120681600 isoform X7 n=1 Tax=Panicum virgatum TaxID=38727 RepID=UPI0019D68DE0|nr:uncharacterized protein LOC120681600 isoform X7 [Panicum virgatum]
MHTPLFSSSCVDWEKLMSVVHALSLDAATARSGRRWCLGRLNHKTWWLCSLSGLCLWGPCTAQEDSCAIVIFLILYSQMIHAVYMRTAALGLRNAFGKPASEVFHQSSSSRLDCMANSSPLAYQA